MFNVSIREGVNRFVYFSSLLADDPCSSAYAKSKRAAEAELIELFEAHKNNRMVILRPPNVYGPGMKGAIITFIKLARSRMLPALPELSNIIAMVSVGDLCRVAMDAASGSGLLCCSVSDGQKYTPNRIESAIYSALERRVPAIRVPFLALYIGALVIELAKLIGINDKSRFGLEGLKKLADDRVAVCGEFEHLTLESASTLESEMAEIVLATNEI